MNMELEGVVKVINDPQTFGGGFTKREIVLTVEDGKYPQDIVFEFHADKISKLDAVGSGDKIKINFGIRGKEYNGRYFNNLVGWKIDMLEAGAVDQHNTEKADGYQPQAEDEDDIPF